MSDELLKRLETGHDKECAMSYGMHEHCCDCSYPARQEAAARVRELEAERDELNAGWQRTYDHDTKLLLERAARAEAERDVLIRQIAAIRETFHGTPIAEVERLRGLLRRLIDANPRYNAGERLQLDLEAALAGEKP